MPIERLPLSCATPDVCGPRRYHGPECAPERYSPIVERLVSEFGPGQIRLGWVLPLPFCECLLCEAARGAEADARRCEGAVAVNRCRGERSVLIYGGGRLGGKSLAQARDVAVALACGLPCYTAQGDRVVGTCL